jgi:hypothetical protein
MCWAMSYLDINLYPDLVKGLSLFTYRTNEAIEVILFPKSFRTPDTPLPVDRTLCTASILLAIGRTPSTLHLHGHGNHIIGF